MKYLIVLLLLLFSLQCDSPTESTEDNTQFIADCEYITNFQIEYAQKIDSLYVMLDSTIVNDSIEQLLLSDTIVNNVSINSKFINVFYKNGILGGFDFTDYSSSGRKMLNDNVVQNSIEDTDEQPEAIYIESFEVANDKLINHLTNFGYKCTTIRPENATLDSYTNLSKYKVICFGGHTQRVYNKNVPGENDMFLRTGEQISNEISLKYKDIINTSAVGLIYVNSKKINLYHISSKFIQKFGDMKKNTQVIIGYFCWSNGLVESPNYVRSKWGINLGEKSDNDVFIGYSSKVDEKSHNEFMDELFGLLTNTNEIEPYTIEDWYNVCDKEKTNLTGKSTSISFLGNKDFTLWENEVNEVWEITGDNIENCTMVLKENEKGEIVAEGEWRYMYNGAIASCPFTTGTGIINVNDINVTASGTATYPDMGTSSFNLSITISKLIDTKGFPGTFEINFDNVDWTQNVQGNFYVNVTSGSGLLIK